MIKYIVIIAMSLTIGTTYSNLAEMSPPETSFLFANTPLQGQILTDEEMHATTGQSSTALLDWARAFFLGGINFNNVPISVNVQQFCVNDKCVSGSFTCINGTCVRVD